ncbi:MAG: GNAT family N-acetyltransferase [Clostridia bacterium]|nr:GNAT family N-acetyltransferase [Clostridia bacterium]
MKFRSYKDSDAEEILSWVRDEREFRLWSSSKYPAYPIFPEEMSNSYLEKKVNFYPLVLEDEGKIIGHLTLEKIEGIVKLGFVIIDSNMRGKGLGKKLVKGAVTYAKEELGAKSVILRVFMNNERALNCYKSAGFNVTGVERNAYNFHGEAWDRAEMEIM